MHLPNPLFWKYTSDALPIFIRGINYFISFYFWLACCQMVPSSDGHRTPLVGSNDMVSVWDLVGDESTKICAMLNVDKSANEHGEKKRTFSHFCLTFEKGVWDSCEKVNVNFSNCLVEGRGVEEVSNQLSMRLNLLVSPLLLFILLLLWNVNVRSDLNIYLQSRCDDDANV